MFVSVIIPTVGRASLVRSVNSVLNQEFKEDDFEVVVVNDTGRPLAAAPWQTSPRVQVLESQKRNRCFARNAGATVAKGRYFLFLDDDDWLLPWAFAALWIVAQQSAAGWIYGAVNFLDGQEAFLAEHHIGAKGNAFVQLVAGDWIALTGSLIKSDLFFAVGGFDSRYVAANVHELNRKLAFSTELATTLKPVACVLRDRKTTTTDYGIFERLNVMSRDVVLSQKGAFFDSRYVAANVHELNRKLAFSTELATTLKPVACVLRDRKTTTTDYGIFERLNVMSRDVVLSQKGAFLRMRDSVTDPYWAGKIVRAYLTCALYNLRERRVAVALNRGWFAMAGLILSGPSMFRPVFWKAITQHHSRSNIF